MELIATFETSRLLEKGQPVVLWYRLDSGIVFPFPLKGQDTRAWSYPKPCERLERAEAGMRLGMQPPYIRMKNAVPSR